MEKSLIQDFEKLKDAKKIRGDRKLSGLQNLKRPIGITWRRDNHLENSKELKKQRLPPWYLDFQCEVSSHFSIQFWKILRWYLVLSFNCGNYYYYVCISYCLICVKKQNWVNLKV